MQALLLTPGVTEAGGAAVRSRLIAETLHERGWRVVILARSSTLKRFRLERRERWLVIEVPNPGVRWRGAVLYAALCAIAGPYFALRSNALLAVQLSAPAVVAAILGRITGRPFVVMSTNSGTLSDVRELVNAAPVGLRTVLVRRAACFVSQTPEGAAEFQALAPPERIRVIPNPVLEVTPPPLPRRPTALFSGRFAREKDLPTLLAAWRTVSSELGEARLILVGSGGDFRSVEDELRQLVDKDPVLDRSVEFTGWVEDVGAYLAMADVYVTPTTAEGMSNSLLEACAWRRVVIATNIPANIAVLGPGLSGPFRPRRRGCPNGTT